MAFVEDVFVTEGVPKLTFVKPPNYGALFVDIRRPGKPVIIEGQSGTGKTTTVKKALSEIYPENPPRVLTPREPADLETISDISEASGAETFIIDDFHRLDSDLKTKLANLAKLIAERDNRTELPKLVIIGINNVGSDLIQMVPDVAKRMGIHRIAPGNRQAISEIVELGSKSLNVQIEDHETIFDESQGDYWLTQQICKTICVSAEISETQDSTKTIGWDVKVVKAQVVANLTHNYDPPVKEFCRGQRFRRTNDPYYKLLKAVSEQVSSNVDLNELANTQLEIKGSINNVKDGRLSLLLERKEDCARLFYYDASTKNFAIEDPALFYYLKNLDWDALRKRCGFTDGLPDYEFDLAISFAGENRDLAQFMTEQFTELDISVFYDRHYEDNYLGELWDDRFQSVFGKRSRLVVALLDKRHREKIWPTFERDCFRERVGNDEVIPIFLDRTVFAGIPQSLVSIHFPRPEELSDEVKDRIIDEIVLRIATKLDSL